MPYVRNFPRDAYGASNQNWVVTQDSAGIIYVGNHSGLLEYDGCRWTLHPVDGGGAVRSVCICGDRIYAGSYQEFGYFERNEAGSLEYFSLSSALSPGDLHNQQIWSITDFGGLVYFQSFGGYYGYSPADGTVRFHRVHFSLNRFVRSNDGSCIAIPFKDGIFMFDGHEMPVPDDRRQVGSPVKDITPFIGKGCFLAATESDGIMHFGPDGRMEWKTDADGRLRKAGLNRIMVTRDSTVLVGTVLNGLFAFDISGRLLWHLDADNGLQNNTVLDMAEDREGNVWLALHYGVSMVDKAGRVAIRKWRQIGSVYDVQPFGDSIYIATGQGLFRTDMSGGRASLVPGTEGFVIDLHLADRVNLVVGHNNSTLCIRPDGSVRRLSGKGGGMCIRNVEMEDGELLLVSGYTTFSVYRKDKASGQWLYSHEMKGFSNPVQSFELDNDGHIWAGHSNSGLFRITPEDGFRSVREVVFLPSPDSVTAAKTGVFKVNDRIVFTDGRRCYAYDGIRDEIVPYDRLNGAMGRFSAAKRIVRAGGDRYWFITGAEAALADFSGDAPEIVNYLGFSDYGFVMLDNFENIVPGQDGISYLCIHNGIAAISDSRRQSEASFPLVSIAGVSAYGSDGSAGTALFPGDGSEDVPYKRNNLTFKLSSPIYGSPVHIRARLSGIDEDWAAVAPDGVVSYSRLPAGRYTFEAGCEDAAGSIGNIVSFSFRIRPPFYASVAGWILWTALFAGLVTAMYVLIRRHGLKEARTLKEKQDREIMRLENEKLQAELAWQAKDLAGISMNLIRRSEMLQTLKDELESQKEALGTQYPNKYYNRMMSLIEGNMSSDQEWDAFYKNFDMIHDKFFRHLSERYPSLSPSDLKLCALLRLNMDTKEIAKMLNITVRGVETRRYRLRRKLGLASDESLSVFLINMK